MEITDIKAYAVNMPVTPLEEGGIAPYVTNHGAVSDMDRILVRVETDQGITGWGEMRVFLSPDVTITVLEDGIAPWVVGHSPYEVEGLRRQNFVEYTNTDMFFSPIEVACWDIVGKALDKPIYELLGGWTAPNQTERPFESQESNVLPVDVAYCVGILSPEESREHATKALEDGYTVLKTKAGVDWKQDVKRIVAMDEAVSGELDFRLDPNQGCALTRQSVFVQLSKMLACTSSMPNSQFEWIPTEHLQAFERVRPSQSAQTKTRTSRIISLR